MTEPIFFAFSPETIREQKLDQPEQLRRIVERMTRDGTERAPLHLRLARLLRPLRRPSPAQAAIEADADALSAAYGDWYGQRIAACCGDLDRAEDGRSPETWRRIAWELSWRMGCAPRRYPRSVSADSPKAS